MQRYFFPNASKILILFFFSCKIMKIMQSYPCIFILFLKKKNAELNMWTSGFVRLNEKWLDYAALLFLTYSCHLLLSEPSFFLPNLYVLLLKILCNTWSLLYSYVNLTFEFLKYQYNLPILCFLLFSLISFAFLVVHENAFYVCSRNKHIFFTML